MPWVTYEQLQRSVLDKILPGSQSLPSSFFRNPAAFGMRGARRVFLEREDGQKYAMVGVTRVGIDIHIVSK